MKDQLKRSHVIAGLTATLVLVAASVAFGRRGARRQRRPAQGFSLPLLQFRGYLRVARLLRDQAVAQRPRRAPPGDRKGLDAMPNRPATEAEAKFAEYDRKLAKAAEEIEDNPRRDSPRRGVGAPEDRRQRPGDGGKDQGRKPKERRQRSGARPGRNCGGKRPTWRSSIAKDMLKKNFTPQDQTRLVNEYMQKVGELH